MAGFRLSIRYTLSGLKPTPQRLRELIAAFARWGYSEVHLDWRDSFPWAMDERFHDSGAYREDLVAGLSREARGHGITLSSVFPAPDALELIARMKSYRRLFREEPAGPVLGLDTPAGRSFYAELADDYLSLLPDASTVLIDCRAGAVAPRLLARAAQHFREQGLRTVAHYAGPAGRLPEDLPALLEGFDLVALPYADARIHSRAYPGRLIPVLSTHAERDAVTDEARSGGPGAESDLLLSFQPQRGAAEGRTAGGILFESIETELPAVRLAAERFGIARTGGVRAQTPDDTTAVEGIVDLDRRLEEALGEGWRWSRAVHETLHDAAGRAPRRELLESLAGAYRRALDLSRELCSRLVEVVEPIGLEQALAMRLGALYEEHLALCGRAGVLVTVDAPDVRGVCRRLENDRFSC